jgi:transposase
MRHPFLDPDCHSRWTAQKGADHLAPLANDSGKRSGHRSIRGGRAAVRSILLLVADIARKYNADLTSFRDRLIAQGKPKMVVRIALARKLRVRLNAKVRDVRLSLANAD